MASNVWVGVVSDASQYFDLLEERLLTIGANYDSKYDMNFMTIKQENRHIEHWNEIKNINIKNNNNNNNNDMKTNNNDNDNSNKKRKYSSIKIDSQYDKSLISSNCLSCIIHSKFEDSIYILFENNIVKSSKLLISAFIVPFKLKKKSKSIKVNGKCYVLNDINDKDTQYLIYFGQIFIHNSPSDYIVIEVEIVKHNANKRMKMFNYNSLLKQIQTIFYKICIKYDKIIIFDFSNNNENYMEMDTNKSQKIRWLKIPRIDFTKLDINPSHPFDGRHLSALYARAFAQILLD